MGESAVEKLLLRKNITFVVQSSSSLCGQVVEDTSRKIRASLGQLLQNGLEKLHEKHVRPGSPCTSFHYSQLIGLISQGHDKSKIC